MLGDQHFGIDINNVRDIHTIPEYTRLPKSPDFIEGVIEMREHIVAVIHLNKKLGFPFKEDDEESRIIVVELGKEMVGLRVDMVKEVIEMDDAEIRPAPSVIQIPHEFIRGILKYNESLLILLNAEKILTSKESLDLANAVENLDKKPVEQQDPLKKRIKELNEELNS